MSGLYETIRRHRHEWSALWDHPGPYGVPDTHRHGCLIDDCDAQMIGPGKICSGKLAGHTVEVFEQVDAETWGLTQGADDHEH